jgi:hypothetical protein
VDMYSANILYNDQKLHIRKFWTISIFNKFETLHGIWDLWEHHRTVLHDQANQLNRNVHLSFSNQSTDALPQVDLLEMLNIK